MHAFWTGEWRTGIVNVNKAAAAAVWEGNKMLEDVGFTFCLWILSEVN